MPHIPFPRLRPALGALGAALAIILLAGGCGDDSPGRYQIFCSIPGHREAGMTGVLEVR